MKKTSKRIIKDYSKLNFDDLKYYGILIKNDRARIDTKRYKKFISLPDKKIEKRQTVYYIPTKIHKNDYIINRFLSLIDKIINEWHNEFSKAINNIKTPKEVEDDVRTAHLVDGIYEYDEASMIGTYAGILRISKYCYIIKSLYAQYFQHAMSQIDALILKVVSENEYNNNKFSRDLLDKYIINKLGEESSLRKFESYPIYDKAYKVWNFLKHNSLKAYKQLYESYPEMLYENIKEYENGCPAINVLKFDEKFVLEILNNLKTFFEEFCTKLFHENTKDAKWDYDDYFINEVKEMIENITNPLGTIF